MQIERDLFKLRNYEVDIKNNLLNDESLNQYIGTIQSKIVWKNDTYYQEQLSLFKVSSENISNSCTKFSKLITLKATNEAISSIVGEIKIHAHSLYTYLLLFIHWVYSLNNKLIINGVTSGVSVFSIPKRSSILRLSPASAFKAE